MHLYKIHEKNMKTKMIIQVHDELVFDVPNEEIEQMKKILELGGKDVNNIIIN